MRFEGEFLARSHRQCAGSSRLPGPLLNTDATVVSPVNRVLWADSHALALLHTARIVRAQFYRHFKLVPCRPAFTKASERKTSSIVYYDRAGSR
jgi:hypothetical protein